MGSMVVIKGVIKGAMCFETMRSGMGPLGSISVN